MLCRRERARRRLRTSTDSPTNAPLTFVVLARSSANTAFAPSVDEIQDARGVLQAWEDGRGSGVVTHNGRMIENLHVETAQRVLAIADAIAALED